MDPKDSARFWSRVDVRGPDECWLWTGKPNAWGYGNIKIKGKTRIVHTVAYELSDGPIPVGMKVDHLCHVAGECLLVDECPHRLCCNPRHLQTATDGENIRRGNGVAAKNAAKEACPKCGGPYVVRSDGRRICRPCTNAQLLEVNRRWRARQRGGSTLSV